MDLFDRASANLQRLMFELEPDNPNFLVVRNLAVDAQISCRAAFRKFCSSGGNAYKDGDVGNGY